MDAISNSTQQDIQRPQNEYKIEPKKNAEAQNENTKQIEEKHQEKVELKEVEYKEETEEDKIRKEKQQEKLEQVKAYQEAGNAQGKSVYKAAEPSATFVA